MRFWTIILACCACFVELSAQTSGTWVNQYSGTSNILIGVSATDDDTAFVCGTGGAFLKTYNGGAQWISVSSGSAQDYYGIDFVNGTTGFVVGNNGAIRKTSNGGLNWTPSWLGNTHMRCVRFIDPLNVLVGGANGLIGKSVDGGANWTICSSGTSANIYDIFFISSSTGYAVCFDGSVLITYDGGYNWSVHPSGVTTKLNQIHFTDSLNGILTGSNGVIRRSTDGGLTWSPAVAPGTSNDLGGLEFPDPLHGFASGSVPTVSGAIMETLDGGISWDTVYSSAVSLTGMDFANANTGYVVGYSGKILKYTTATGMAEASTDDPLDIQVFPNPASDELHVSLKINSIETIRIEVFDLVGERAAVIFEGKVSESSSYTADISQLPGGVYFVKCSGSICAVRKFVKN